MNQKLRNVLRGSSVFGAALTILAPGALAQTNIDDLEELEVLAFTGTRLTGAALEGSLPVTTFSRAELDLSPAVSAGEFLRDLTITGGPSTQTSNFTNGTDGAARVALRNINGANTLMLLNGRRLQPTGTGSTVDVNQIPFNALRSIEILKAGGSTVYGTSGVAGVINFIIDDEFEGLQINASYANTTSTDVHETTVDFILGGQGDGGRFSYMVGGRYRKQASLLAVDRPYMLGGGHSILPNPGLFFFGPAVAQEIIDANGFTAAELTGVWTLKDGVNIATSPSDFRPFVNRGPEATDALGRRGDRFPFENFTISMNPNEQYSLFAFTDYQLTDTVKVFTEMIYNYSELMFQLAAAPVANLRIGPENRFYNEIFSSAAIASDAAATPIGPLVYYRFVELGPRIVEYERRLIRFVGGVDVDLPSNFNMNAYYLFTEENRVQRELAGGSQRDVQERLNSAGADAFNLFGAAWVREAGVGVGFQQPNPVIDAQGQSIRADNTREYKSKTELIDVRFSNGDLLDLPAGPLQAVAGIEWRRESAVDKPDALKLSGSLGWNAASGVTDGSREVYGVYGEVGIPVIDKVDLNLSLRHERYTNNSPFVDTTDKFNTTVAGAFIRWQPIADLTLRAGWSQGFVAPEIIDVYNPGLSGFPELNDPFFPAGDPDRLYQVQTFYVGSAFDPTGTGLSPEEADIYSIGFTYSPNFIRNLDITVDYSRIEKTDLIVYSVQGVVNEFRASYAGGNDGSQTHPPANNPFLVENGGQIQYDPASISPIRAIFDAGPRNVAGQKLDTLDISVNYLIEFETAGSLNLRGDLTYYFTLKQQSATTGDWFSFLGEYDGDVAYPRYLANINATYAFGDWTFGATWRYIHGTRDINVPVDFDGKTRVEGHSEVDVVAQWRMPFFRSGLRQSTLTVGVRNLFDQDPPLMDTAFSNNYPERNYDPRGAYYFIRFRQDF